VERGICPIAKSTMMEPYIIGWCDVDPDELVTSVIILVKIDKKMQP